jgi:hypothetical protein
MGEIVEIVNRSPSKTNYPPLEKRKLIDDSFEPNESKPTQCRYVKFNENGSIECSSSIIIGKGYVYHELDDDYGYYYYIICSEKNQNFAKALAISGLLLDGYQALSFKGFRGIEKPSVGEFIGYSKSRYSCYSSSDESDRDDDGERKMHYKVSFTESAIFKHSCYRGNSEVYEPFICSNYDEIHIFSDEVDEMKFSEFLDEIGKENEYWVKWEVETMYDSSSFLDMLNYESDVHLGMIVN